MIFDPAGNLLDTWGAGQFVRPHGIAFDGDGNLFLTDVGLHTVQKRTPDGRLLMEIGTPRMPAPLLMLMLPVPALMGPDRVMAPLPVADRVTLPLLLLMPDLLLKLDALTARLLMSTTVKAPVDP